MNQPVGPRHGPAVFDVREFGAAGTGTILDTRAIQTALDACSHFGGGTVLLPAGRYLSGALFLHSRTTLVLDAGAVLLGSTDPADFPLIRSRWEGLEQDTHAPLIGGNGLEQVAVSGRGTVDGQGQVWWQRHRERTLDAPRPRLISFQNCRNVLIEGITAINSPSWTITPLCCENVTVDRVSISNPPDSPNTDGINPDSCRNVHIANCHIDVGDDCVTIKSGVETNGRDGLGPCENITVTNCTMVHGHGGVVIGSEMSGDIRNVVISNCVFSGTDRGIRFKSRRGRGGVVEDVRVTNVVMQDVLCPFTMNLYYACGRWGDPLVAAREPHPVSDGTPRFRRIHLSNVSATGATIAAGFLYGLAEMPLEQISLSDISIRMAAGGEAGYPDMADDLEPMQQAGFIIRNIRGLRLHNLSVGGQIGAAVTLHDAADVDLSACASTPATPEAPALHFKDVEDAFVHGCRAAAGDVFLRVEGPRSREIVLSGNHLARSRQGYQLAEDARAGAVTEL